MEFDTLIKLRPTGSYQSSSSLGWEECCAKVWEILTPECKHAGDSGAGEFWLDFSDPLRTKHVVVNVERVEEGYEIKFRAGSRPGRIADLVMIGLGLLIFWILSKIFVPSPDPLYLAGLAFSSAALVVILYLVYGRTFGEKQTEQLLEKLRREKV